MVSALWKVCADGDLEKAFGLLNDGSSVDIEVKDHTGVTPLICAVQNGHAEIVRALLEKGADPTNASSQGPPEQYTSDPAILELLVAAKSKTNPNGLSSDAGYTNDPNDPSKVYYPPPGAYYYPGVPAPPSVLPDGSVAYYLPPPPPGADSNGTGLPNLPPPDVARMIPCRYYPACRYGTSCMFAHPQGPYLQGSLPPPAQYPAPYDPMNPTPYPAYYSVPPPSFPPGPNGTQMSPVSPPPGTNPVHPHARSTSELISPIHAPFSPNGVPPPMPYGVISPISPTYAHPGPVPLAIPPLPPLHHPSGPQSPQQTMYPPTSPISAGPIPQPFVVRPDAVVQQYLPQGPIPNGFAPDSFTSLKSSFSHQGDAYGPGHINRDGMTHHRRGSARRPSFGGFGRKPPCLFFPSGRCRNGDDCRFPHILPDGPVPHHAPHFASRGGHRPRPTIPHVNGMNGFATIEDKFATLTVQDDGQSPQNQQNGTAGANGTDDSSRSQSAEPGSRGREYQSYKSNHFTNGPRIDKRPVAPKPQRLPSADDFPVLTGSSTPPLRSPASVSVSNGLTAAQILQAPAPVRKDKDSQPATRGGSPDPASSSKESKPETNSSATNTPLLEPAANKLPVSFAAVAAPEMAKEIAVAA